MGGVVSLNLVYLPVLVPLGGDLRLVSDAQHLGVLAQFAQQAADDLRHATADAHVHLVEELVNLGLWAQLHHQSR